MRNLYVPVTISIGIYKGGLKFNILVIISIGIIYYVFEIILARGLVEIQHCNTPFKFGVLFVVSEYSRESVESSF
ncbi:Uncharacterized protein TCM_035140 [Theobroma cacao]|uniref:Uncharacterized protein n=1 Tax=Theobroma cacao TaxID=3641 RepID=A0A061FP69_THECC|nr:Uncharacterized protein TCM_035140 [Theobroma cacao]